MKWRALFLTAASMLMLSAAVRAGECGNGLPCGSIPWPQPNPPQLQSPTPMPTIALTQIPPTQTPGGPTATPAPTNTPPVNVGDINDQVATLGAVIQSTPMGVNDINGTPVDTDATFAELGSNAGTFFGYVRTMSEVGFGQLTPLVALGFLALAVVISVKLITFLLPIASVFFGILQSVISLVRNLIPL